MNTKIGSLNRTSWSTILIEAILLLIVGICLLFKPNIIVSAIGLFALIGGIVDSISTKSNKPFHWDLRLIGDVILIVTGLFILLFPAVGIKLTTILFYIIAIFGMLLGGSLNIYAGVRQATNKNPGASESLFWGIVLFGSGLFLLNRPLSGTTTFVFALSIWLILSGLTGIFLAARTRTMTTGVGNKKSNIKTA